MFEGNPVRFPPSFVVSPLCLRARSPQSLPLVSLWGLYGSTSIELRDSDVQVGSHSPASAELQLVWTCLGVVFLTGHWQGSQVGGVGD